MKKTELAYAAGFFDGEGCIHMRPNGQIHIAISQVDIRPLQFIKEGPGYRMILRKDARDKDYWLRSAKRDVIVEFLRLIFPYLVLKKEQALLAIEFIESKSQRYHDPKIRDYFYHRLKKLKKERK